MAWLRKPSEATSCGDCYKKGEWLSRVGLRVRVAGHWEWKGSASYNALPCAVRHYLQENWRVDREDERLVMLQPRTYHSHRQSEERHGASRGRSRAHHRRQRSPWRWCGRRREARRSPPRTARGDRRRPAGRRSWGTQPVVPWGARASGPSPRSLAKQGAGRSCARPIGTARNSPPAALTRSMNAARKFSRTQVPVRSSFTPHASCPHQRARPPLPRAKAASFTISPSRSAAESSELCCDTSSDGSSPNSASLLVTSPEGSPCSSSTRRARPSSPRAAASRRARRRSSAGAPSGWRRGPPGERTGRRASCASCAPWTDVCRRRPALDCPASATPRIPITCDQLANTCYLTGVWP